MVVSEQLFKRLSETVDGDEVLDLVRRLVMIPSHWAQPERERPIAEFLKETFESEGIDSYLQMVVDGRPNIIAILRGTGGGPRLMLNGHIDTVPPFGMEAPFAGIVKDGRLYGRGAADMKSGVGTMAYAMIVLKRLGVRLKGDLIFAGVIDEDAAGSAGTHHLIESGPKTDYAIVGEPTSLRPGTAHKGIDCYEIIFHGRSIHSSVPDKGVNAIYAASDFINRVEFDLVPRYRSLIHPLVGAPTVNVGLVQGSAKANRPYLMGESPRFAGIVPDTCHVYLDVRWTPYQTLNEVTQDLESIALSVVQSRPDVQVEVSYLPWSHPAMEISPDTPLVTTLIESIAKASGKKPEITGVTYWGDSGLLYGLAGIPSILFGPGDIGCAHSDLEWVDTRELPIAATVYALAALTICMVED